MENIRLSLSVISIAAVVNCKQAINLYVSLLNFLLRILLRSCPEHYYIKLRDFPYYKTHFQDYLKETKYLMISMRTNFPKTFRPIDGVHEMRDIFSGRTECPGEKCPADTLYCGTKYICKPACCYPARLCDVMYSLLFSQYHIAYDSILYTLP